MSESLHNDLPDATTAPRRRFRNDIAFLLILLALVVLNWLPRLTGPIDLRWDGAVYYILGTSLAEGKGYKLLNEPGEIDATQYPPLLPAIIAVYQWILGTNDFITVGRWLRFSFFLFFVIFILIIYQLLRNHLPAKYAFLGTLLCLFNLHIYFLSDLCFPETLFGITTILFILCNRNTDKRGHSVLAIVFAVASYALRTIGIAALAAWVAESLLNKEIKKTVLRIALALIPILSWQSYISFIESRHAYNNLAYEYQRADYLFYNVSYARNISLLDPFAPEKGYLTFSKSVRRFVHNVTRMPASLGEAVSIKREYWELRWAPFGRELLFTFIIPWLVHFVLIVLGCLVLIGIGLQLLRREWIIALYILIYLAGICLTPFPEQFARYLAPLAPFLVLSLFKFFLAFKDMSHRVFSPPWKAVGLALCVSIVSLILVVQLLNFFQVYVHDHQKIVYKDQNNKDIAYRLFYYGDTYKALDEGLDWLKQRAKPGDVVAASAPHWVYLRTRLKAVMPPFESDPIKAQHLLDTVPVNYLIVDEGALDTKKYLIPLLENSPERWRQVYSVPEGRFAIYQRVNP